ncbi:hypothetical protein N7474_008142 [Penicillium riverlandense]|uniref:uncharacterized protein n=1 Tax=Penicillium riverlandense TaxID=1903569 RepID=UPI0025465BAA|nr:uncharacterized protein N7474_008142 [Penicillium riverlandense]KAJ5811841.1 hypothetical protein N7474_008142 [Penicillium riverlandense]
MGLFSLIIALALLSAVDAAALSANYPINAQLPPVARVDQHFQFVFAPSTFANTDADTKYSLKNAPSWLEVDSSSRTLSGTPSSDDTGSKKFQLVGSDGSDSDSMDVTLIVTTDQGPTLGKPLITQLQAMGPVSYPSTLFIQPGHDFTISFDKDTFQNTHPSTIYYGTSPNNTPLPSWIEFDATALKFSGNSPSFPGSSSEAFTFQLVASDVAGYSAVNMTFEIVIGPHILAFNETTQAFNLTRGQKFNSPSYRDLLSLDGSPTSSQDVTSVDADLPDWLTLDEVAISLSGTPSDGAVNQNITITVTDTYQDQAKLMLRLEFLELFLDTIQGCEATIGEDFTFVFNQSIITDNSVQLDVGLPQQLSSWLTYDSGNKTLHGHVPADVQPHNWTIPLTAHQGSTKNTRNFELDIVKASDSHDPEDPSTPFSTSASPSHRKAGIIAISVVIPIVAVLSLMVLFFCLRRRRESSTVEEELPKPKGSPPPRPVRPDAPLAHENTAFREDPSGDDTSYGWLSSTIPASDLPKLELGPAWNMESFGKEQTPIPQPQPSPPPRSPARGTFHPLRDSTAGEEKNRASNSPSKSPKKQTQRLSFNNPSPVRRRRSSRREPLKPIQPRAMKRESVQSTRSKRYSKRSSGISSVASGLPVRLSGAGHGAGGFGPPGHGVVQISWQNAKASFPNDENSLNNIAPLFPRPPNARTRHSMASSIPDPTKRLTLRTVEPDDSPTSEADSLEAFVHSRAKNRNSTNPLFSGQVDRRVSSGLRALERARSQRNRADTVSVSTFSDEYRQSIQERPVSMAISASEYGGEDSRFSQYQSLQPPPNLHPLAEGAEMSRSQLSLAHDYRGVISPLPRFWSDNSLSSARRLASGSHEQPPQPSGGGASAMPQSSSMVSDLEEHLSRKASPQKSKKEDRGMSLEPPPTLKNFSSQGLPVASSGELAFV